MHLVASFDDAGDGGFDRRALAVAELGAALLQVALLRGGVLVQIPQLALELD